MRWHRKQVTHQSTCKCSNCKSITTYYWTQNSKQRTLAITGDKNGKEKFSIFLRGKNYITKIDTSVHLKYNNTKYYQTNWHHQSICFLNSCRAIKMRFFNSRGHIRILLATAESELLRVIYVTIISILGHKQNIEKEDRKGQEVWDKYRAQSLNLQYTISNDQIYTTSTLN